MIKKTYPVDFSKRENGPSRTRSTGKEKGEDTKDKSHGKKVGDLS
jgi:hypothetical protein